MARRFYGTWRDADFFNWRYLAHPIFRYRPLITAGSGGAVTGLAVWRVAELHPSGIHLGRVVEFLPAEGFAEPLARALLGALSEEGVSVVDFSTTTECFDRTLADCGFVAERDFTERVPRLLDPPSYASSFVNIVAKNLRASDPTGGFDSFANWYATSADGDQDRPNRPLALT